MTVDWSLEAVTVDSPVVIGECGGPHHARHGRAIGHWCERGERALVGMERLTAWAGAVAEAVNALLTEV